MDNYLKLKPENIIYFFVFILLLIRVLANFNLFDNALSVILPVLIIPLGVFFILSKLNRVGDFKVTVNNFLFYSICLFLLLIPIFQNLFFENLVDGSGRYSHNFIWVISLLSLSWIMAGAVFGSISTFSTSLKIINLLFFTIFFGILFYGLNGGIFVDYQFLTSLRSDDIRIHHLSLTEPLMLVFYIIIAQFYKQKYKWLIILSVLFFMFALGGRVALFCFILSVLIYEFLISNKFNYFFKIAIICFITVYAFLYLSSGLDDTFALHKLFLSDGLENDASFQDRMLFFHDFTKGFLSQIVIGNPNFIIYSRGALGAYDHNILTVMQFNG